MPPIIATLAVNGFNSSASVSVIAGIQYLVVAGGGAYTGSWSGGGGGGGVLEGLLTYTTGTYNVSVGAGASGEASTHTGSNSWFGPHLAYGGGDGNQYATGYNVTPGFAGGSGGGGGMCASSQTNAGGSAVSGQGGPGMINVASSNACGGGGGGLSTLTSSVEKDGSDGYQSSIISGTPTWYAGGGGAGAYGQAGGTGGQGGGGSSAGNQSTASTPGQANTGGGGGGGAGGNGGSGIVVIAYPATHPALTVSSYLGHATSTTSRAGYRVYTLTSGAGNITFN